MAGDLGEDAGEVHAQAAAILAFWFDETPPEMHFTKDDGFDALCGARFGAVRDAILTSGARAWRDDPETVLAAVIALDQFSRNIHRGSARAFEADALALALARHAIAQGWAAAMPIMRRQFLYMPFMHSEDPAVQRESVALFQEIGGENLDYAHRHLEVIERFGRFPGRNDALDRPSTPEEIEFLRQPGNTF